MQAPVARKGWVAGNDYGGEPLGTNSYSPSSLERARDELFSHIRRCGVLDAEFAQREEWLADTVGYLAERYPDLSKIELGELQKIGQRYCKPPKPHGDTEILNDDEAVLFDLEAKKERPYFEIDSAYQGEDGVEHHVQGLSHRVSALAGETVGLVVGDAGLFEAEPADLLVPDLSLHRDL